jgi:hypothetical protein
LPQRVEVSPRESIQRIHSNPISINLETLLAAWQRLAWRYVRLGLRLGIVVALLSSFSRPFSPK